MTCWISGPGGFDVPATFVSVVFNASGNQAVATYSIIPPGGSWDSADNGTYTVVMQPNQVFDQLGNPVAPGDIGSFTVMTSSAPSPTAPRQHLHASSRRHGGQRLDRRVHRHRHAAEEGDRAGHRALPASRWQSG